MKFTGIQILLFTLLILISSPSYAITPGQAATSKTEFCENRKSTDYFTSLAYNTENLLAFKNRGGLLNKGVCWWHNLFQRSAIYLAVFKPEQPKPDVVLARKIIHALAAGRRVVEIPGYKNMSEFSKDWQKEIQRKLEAWQREDGFLKFAWIQGLSGNWNTNPKEIASTLNFAISQAELAGQIHWTMWQLPGITAHASLMIGGTIDTQSANSIYKAHHIDSNIPQTPRVMTWQPPARSVEGYMGKFVPYVARKTDLVAFKTAGDQYCSSRTYDGELAYEPLSNHIE